VTAVLKTQTNRFSDCMMPTLKKLLMQNTQLKGKILERIILISLLKDVFSTEIFICSIKATSDYMFFSDLCE